MTLPQQPQIPQQPLLPQQPQLPPRDTFNLLLEVSSTAFKASWDVWEFAATELPEESRSTLFSTSFVVNLFSYLFNKFLFLEREYG